jgi:hypothetical protein
MSRHFSTTARSRPPAALTADPNCVPQAETACGGQRFLVAETRGCSSAGPRDHGRVR